jgi:hypothetical protein
MGSAGSVAELCSGGIGTLLPSSELAGAGGQPVT